MRTPRLSPEETGGGSKYLCIQINYCSGYIVANAIKAEPSTQTTIYSRTTDLLGFPEEVYSDNASYFQDPDIKIFFKRHGTGVMFGSTYQPSSMGEAEMGVRMVKNGLRQWAKSIYYDHLREYGRTRCQTL